MNDISKLPRWAQDRIAELERELRRWQDLYVDLAKGKDSPFARLITPPADTRVFPPGPTPPSEPHLPPGVYAYMCPFPSTTCDTDQTVTESSGFRGGNPVLQDGEETPFG